MMEKHFVSFTYPGTVVCEEASESIDSWDIDRAVQMAKARHERAFAFKFITRRREDNELDSKVVARSPTYYLGSIGEALTHQDVARGGDITLAANMKSNGWARVVFTRYGNAQPFEDEDVILTSL